MGRNTKQVVWSSGNNWVFLEGTSWRKGMGHRDWGDGDKIIKGEAEEARDPERT